MVRRIKRDPSFAFNQSTSRILNLVTGYTSSGSSHWPRTGDDCLFPVGPGGRLVELAAILGWDSAAADWRVRCLHPSKSPIGTS